MAECEQAVLASPEFKAALSSASTRASEDASLVMVDIWSAGYYGEAEVAEPVGSPGRSASCGPTRPTTATPDPSRAAPGGRPQHDDGRSASRSTADWPLPPASKRTTPPSRRGAVPRGTSSRWRSSSRKGRARGRRPRSAGRSGSFVIGFDAREGLTLHHLRYRRRRQGPLGAVPGLAHRDGGPLRRPRADAAPQERLRRGRIRHGDVRQQPRTGLRLPGPDPLLRRPPLRQPGRAL